MSQNDNHHFYNIKGAVHEVLDLFYDFVLYKDDKALEWWAFLIGVPGLLLLLFVFYVKFGVLTLDANLIQPFIYWFYELFPIGFFLIALRIFAHFWMRYIRSDYISKRGEVLLEIKLPRLITKSPLAMEVFFTSLWQKGTSTLIEAFWLGKVRPWFSFELVSLEGKVHLYVWCDPKYRNLIEAQLYAQYPDIAIREVEDYAKNAIVDPDGQFIWGTNFRLKKPDPYPIKTYVDYGLDNTNQEEETKVDPMSSVIEYLGSLKKGEQAWIQILIQAHKKVGIKDGFLFKRPDWQKEAQVLIKEIRAEATPESDSEFPRMPILTKGQQETISAIERSIGKYPFECGIRGFYIAKKEVFNPINVTGLIGSFRQYSSKNLNELDIGWFTDHDYPWEDVKRKRRTRWESQLLEAYKMRSFFNYPYKFFHQQPFILTTEELATIFHLPGQVVRTPTFDRLPSKRAEPPSNLPV